MVEPPRSRLPQILAVSIGVHVVLGVLLTRIPAGRELLARVIPVAMVDRHKPPKPPKKMPPKPKPQEHHAAKPQAPKALQHLLPAASDGGGPGGGFGIDVGANGTMEVPIGKTLEAQATGSPPLVLDVGDEPGTRRLDSNPVPVGELRVSYPEVARIAGLSGTALVQAFVEADGHVARVELVQASTPTFGRAALEALRQSRFKPARKLGVAVACTIRLPVRFELNEVKVLPVAVEEPDIEDATTSMPIATESSPVGTPSLTPVTPGATPSLPAGVQP